ncbi:O-antigen polymerase [Photobacterium damselae]
MYFQLVLIICLLLFFIYHKNGNRQPVIYFLIVWASITIIYIFSPEYYPLSIETNLYLSFFIVTFCITYMVFQNIFKYKILLPERVYISKNLIYFLCIVVSLFTIIKGILILNTLGFNLMLFRTQLMAGNITGLGIGISLPISFLGLYLSRRSNNVIMFIIFFCFSLVISLISTSKIFLLLVVMYSMGINNKIEIKKIFFISIGILSVFILSSILLNKFSSSINDGFFNAIYDTFRVYFISGVSAFNLYINDNAFIPNNILLYPFKDLLSDAYDIPLSDILPWINTGTWDTNVYTGFLPWYQAIGFISCFILGGGLGIYYAFWFNPNLGYIAKFYQIFLYFPLLILFFQEHFLLSWKMHLSYILCMLLLVFVKNRELHE